MSASGRNDFTCPLCKRNFEDCKHSWKDIETQKEDERIRAIVRQEIKRLNTELSRNQF